jgi:hypothetical protein
LLKPPHPTWARFCVFGRERKLGGEYLLRSVVDDAALACVRDHFVERLGHLDIRAADHPAVAGRIVSKADLSEIGGGLVILVLGPALERMIMAFVAVESEPEKQLVGILHGPCRIAQDLESAAAGFSRFEREVVTIIRTNLP